jgi:hypothetical protein
MLRDLRRTRQVLAGASGLLCAALLPAAYPDLSKGRPPIVLDARIGPNLRLGDDPAALPASQRGQAEPHIVRSFANPALLLATFQEGRLADGGALGCGYAVSLDGGLTWRRELIPNLTPITRGRFERATDPVAGAGPQGDLYLQTLGSVQSVFAQAAVVVSRSTDNGATWSSPVTVFESSASTPAPDKNWLAVNDYPGTPNSGRLVSTWTGFVTNAAGAQTSVHLIASSSDDRGATWSTPVNVTPVGSLNQGSQPVFLPDGSLAVLYITFLNPNNVTTLNLACKRSLDGGRTFPATATSVVPIMEAWDDPQMRDGVFLPSATVARGTGEMFVTYVAVVAGTPRIFVTRSADRGATWSRPVVASDQPTGISVMNPSITASPDGRTVSVFFMDMRDAPNGRDFVDFYLAMSFDGGASWQPNLRLSEMSSEIRYGPQTSRGTMLGDYFAIAPSYAPEQPCVAIWCDTRTGDSDPMVAPFFATPDSDYAVWAQLRGLPPGLTSHLDDPDHDGVPNYLEFLAGTNPLRAESGEDLFVRTSSPTSLELAWTERASGQQLFPFEGVSMVTFPAFSSGGFGTGGATVGTGELEFPAAIAPGQGLVWRGARLTVAPGVAEVVTRAYRWSAGLPVKTSAGFATVNTTSRLINLATRGRSGLGASQMIVGFVIDGGKSVLVRAAGPALAALGVGATLANPSLTLRASATGFERTNDNWAQGTATAALFARLGAFPFPAASLDAALSLPLDAQSYTTTVTDASGASGIVLVETYDADDTPEAPTGPRLVNLSTRCDAGSGDATLIAGFVLSGPQPRRVLIRAIGPSLTSFGVAGALVDPVLTLYRGGAQIAANDDWEISRSAAAIAATAQRVGAFPLTRASLDAALLITLAPGAYTVVVSAADSRTGIALVEVYDAN